MKPYIVHCLSMLCEHFLYIYSFFGLNKFALKEVQVSEFETAVPQATEGASSHNLTALIGLVGRKLAKIALLTYDN